jgi:hypothetical protein
MEFSRFYNLCFSNNDYQCNSIVPDNNENIINNQNQIANEENKVGIEDYNPDKINISYIGDILIKGLIINLHPSIKSSSNINLDNLDYTSMKIGGIEMKISLSKFQFDFNLNSKSIIFGPSKLSIGEKVFISNTSRKKRSQLSNNISNNYNSNDNEYMENSYSKILENIEENTGLTGLLQKYNPNYKLKLKVLDDALEKIETNKKKNSFNDTEISILCNNKNNENNSQFNEVVNNSNNNINLNDSKYGYNNSNNYFYQTNSNSKGKNPKGKKKFKLLYIIIELIYFFCFR